MNPNKALWEKGDFTHIAATMRESGEKFVDSLGNVAGLQVLDLGCGDGTTALPLARNGAKVTGIDIAQNLVDAGNRRVKDEGLQDIFFKVGDACHLQDVKEHTFDLSISVFGAMFAPKPFDVAQELVRVTKPCGRIVMGNWIPNDPTFVSQLLKISSAYTPLPPEGFISPMRWGMEVDILERFGQAGIPKERIALEREVFLFISKTQDPAVFIDNFIRYYGPTMNAVEAAQKANKVEELQRQLVELATSQNTTKAGTLIPATFMRVTVFV